MAATAEVARVPVVARRVTTAARARATVGVGMLLRTGISAAAAAKGRTVAAARATAVCAGRVNAVRLGWLRVLATIVIR
jgi:hypothetical protein